MVSSHRDDALPLKSFMSVGQVLDSITTMMTLSNFKQGEYLIENYFPSFFQDNSKLLYLVRKLALFEMVIKGRHIKELINYYENKIIQFVKEFVILTFLNSLD